MRSGAFLDHLFDGAQIAKRNFGNVEIIPHLQSVLAQLRRDLDWIEIAYPRFPPRSRTCGKVIATPLDFIWVRELLLCLVAADRHTCLVIL
jgi:hypothetical protein